MRTSMLVGLAMIASCDGRTRKQPPPAPAPKPTVAPARPPSPGDITVLSMKTSAGGDVLAIGRPPLQVTDGVTQLQIRLAARRAIAVDRDAVRVWELEGGTLIEHIEPAWDESEPYTKVEMSPGAEWLAIARTYTTQMRAAPFDSVAFRADLSPHAFSRDGKRLVGMTMNDAAILDIAKMTIVAKSPAPATNSIADLALALRGDDVYWIRGDDLLRWSPATNKLDVVVAPKRRWKAAAIAENAPVAVVTDGKSLYRLDLATGTTSAIVATSTWRFAVSPSGERVALAALDGVRVLETRTGKQVTSIKIATPVGELAYTEDDDVIAYLVGQRIHLHDLVRGPRTFSDPSRFHGWLANGVATVARGAKLEQLAVATRASAPADASAIAPKRLAGAPAWATWVDGAVAAEPSPRSLLPAYRRWEQDCAPKLRVWTAKGGERTFTLKSAGDDIGDLSAVDPCWQLSGGYVIAATLDRIEVYDPTTGRRIAKLEPGEPPEYEDDPTLAHHYWAVAASPSGSHLALWWRRADVWAPEQPVDPRRDVLHIHEDDDKPECETERGSSHCKREYFAEVWSLAGKPARIWQHRPDAGRATTRTWPLPKVATGAIAFTHDGKHVLFGFDDGDVMIHAVDSSKPMRIESLHRAPITRIEVSPGDGYVFSEDRAGEQRIWPLVRP